MMQNIISLNNDPIALPESVCFQAAQANRFSIVGVVLNPKKQNLHDLIEQLPSIWDVGDNVVGRIVDSEKFQFLFQSEETMSLVLGRGPWSFTDWMLVVQRWTPNMSEEALKIIPFWIQIRGIPFQYLTRPMIKYIGDKLWDVVDVDFEEAANRVDFVRVRVNWNVDNPLRFQHKFHFGHDEDIILSLRYERLKNFCCNCGMLTHEEKNCPLNYDDDGYEKVSPHEIDGDNEELYRFGVSDNYDNNKDYLLTAGQSNDSVSEGKVSPFLVEDRDMKAETWRYMQAKFAKGKFTESDFLNLIVDYIKQEEQFVATNVVKMNHKNDEEGVVVYDSGNQNWRNIETERKDSRIVNNNEDWLGYDFSDMSQGFDYKEGVEKENHFEMINNAKGKFIEDEFIDECNDYVNTRETTGFNRRKREEMYLMLQNPLHINDNRMGLYPINKRDWCESHSSYSVNQIEKGSAGVLYPPQSP